MGRSTSHGSFTEQQANLPRALPRTISVWIFQGPMQEPSMDAGFTWQKMQPSPMSMARAQRALPASRWRWALRGQGLHPDLHHHLCESLTYFSAGASWVG